MWQFLCNFNIGNMTSEIFIFFIAFLIILKYSRIFTTSTSNHPPGPWKLPILGHLPFLGLYPHETMMKWAGKYGPIISVQFGSFTAVVLNDTATIKAAFNLPSLTGRPKIKYTDETTMNRSGFIWRDGPAAKEIRQFVQRKLKDFGFGGQMMELQMQEHVSKLMEVFECHLHSKLVVNHDFGVITLNYLRGVIFGTEDTKDEKEFQKFTEQLIEIPTATPLLALSILLPKLLSWFPNLTGYTKRLRVIEEVREYVEKVITMHEKTHIIDAPRDLIDGFLDQEKISPHVFSKVTLYTSVLELLSAGNDTSSAILGWVIFYSVKHPEIQDELAREIEAKIPTNQEPRFSDRSNMPYCEAVLNETLRMSSILPLSVFHSALEDTDFQEFLIKKDTMVIANNYAAHYDPSVWENPTEFKPERFLGEDGQLNDEISKLLAFSTGKRKCIGETFARNQLFLFVVNIFRHYELKSFGKFPPVRTNTLGFIQTCGAFSVEVSRRS